MLLLVAPAFLPPIFSGDPEAALHLEEPLRAALNATTAYGPWPEGRWEVRLHSDAATFERVAKAGPYRGALWIGEILHVRPWEQLKRRDVGAILRHELVHHRLSNQGLMRWEEEGRCLHAETHVRPPTSWPAAPTLALQGRLDRALTGGTTQEQAWAYRWLRAWGSKKALPPPPAPPRPLGGAWRKEAMVLGEKVFVTWPPERLPGNLTINGHELSKEARSHYRFTGKVGFGGDMTLGPLTGTVTASRRGKGWSLTWVAGPDDWVAAATAGELGEGQPFEARRALAAVLKCWLKGHPRGNHPDGSFCPLTHCAVIRGDGGEDTRTAARSAPTLVLDARGAFFCGSKGGVALSAREVWGDGPESVLPAEPVPGDRWRVWTRSLTASQVSYLKANVRPGLKPGQKGLLLGASGPYPIEELRLATGRAFGWTAWPSNACEGEVDGQGRLQLKGNGWGHNVGLCLATASWQARQGQTAEAILGATFGPEALK